MDQNNLILDNCSFEDISQIYSANNGIKPNSLYYSTSTIEIFEDSEEQQTKQSTKKSQTKAKKLRKAQDFTLYQDQRILTLILKYGPKFKKISRLLNGKPVNILKNRYYRHLRYKWDEILGEEYAFLNESKEKVNLQQILNNIPLVPEYSKIITNLILNIQATLSSCFSQTKFGK